MSTDRRRFLGVVGAALALPFGTASRAASDVFSPPASPMVFTRTLRREMFDGTAMSATRAFAIRFLPEGDGFTVDGEQAGMASVEAPPSLDVFAELERERREIGMFPVHLDRTGRIFEERARHRPLVAPSPQFDRAVGEALHRVAASNRSDDEQATIRMYVLALQQAAASLATLPPAGLFCPPAAPVREGGSVALPDGATGEVWLTFTARSDPATGLMREAERLILTRLADSERRTLESWTLAPA